MPEATSADQLRSRLEAHLSKLQLDRATLVARQRADLARVDAQLAALTQALANWGPQVATIVDALTTAGIELRLRGE